MYPSTKAKIRTPSGERVRIEKKAHIMVDGTTVCKSENGYKKLRFTVVDNPSEGQICLNCQRKLENDASQDLAVVLGERTNG